MPDVHHVLHCSPCPRHAGGTNFGSSPLNYLHWRTLWTIGVLKEKMNNETISSGIIEEYVTGK